MKIGIIRPPGRTGIALMALALLAGRGAGPAPGTNEKAEARRGAPKTAASIYVIGSGRDAPARA